MTMSTDSSASPPTIGCVCVCVFFLSCLVRQRTTKGELIDVDSPFKMPDADKRTGTQEPFVKLEMLTPQVKYTVPGIISIRRTCFSKNKTVSFWKNTTASPREGVFPWAFYTRIHLWYINSHTCANSIRTVLFPMVCTSMYCMHDASCCRRLYALYVRIRMGNVYVLYARRCMERPAIAACMRCMRAYARVIVHVVCAVMHDAYCYRRLYALYARIRMSNSMYARRCMRRTDVAGCTYVLYVLYVKLLYTHVHPFYCAFYCAPTHGCALFSSRVVA